ncbi:metalloregulator ArsR/SmtB family transcription factor [Collinsella ureilytica]|uniref:metalloregulator ArsR/SmtB family transcription factor n=1 Tax=Collinsella ureilytica TaxID=2869515 RepID=UPI0027D2A3F7|nr:metalloregulator ArsR/SmtB family transcription factor [Collinsella urealyticum]
MSDRSYDGRNMGGSHWTPPVHSTDGSSAQLRTSRDNATDAPTAPVSTAPAPQSIDPLPSEETLSLVADLFRMFADTTRVKILCSLMEGERAVREIAEAVGSSQSAVSHQLRTLRQARLVKFHREGRSVLYSLDDDHVNTIMRQGMSHVMELAALRELSDEPDVNAVQSAAVAVAGSHADQEGRNATMRKTFKLDEIDCAACAAKLEEDLAAVDGVQKVSINFMTQKLALEAAESSFNEVLDRVIDRIAELEPDCAVLV